jgi:hypothetical protein
MTLSRSQPCFEVFTDDPESIARRLPRPKTPFVPAPALPVRAAGKHAAAEDVNELRLAESPPTCGDFGDGLPDDGCGISFF